MLAGALHKIKERGTVVKNGTIDLVICPKCKTDIVVDVNEGEPTIAVDDVQEIIHEWFKTGGLTVFQYSNIVKEIKQKARL